MTYKVIGLIQLQDESAFEEYRSQVGRTVELYGGTIATRGSLHQILWNELGCGVFEAFVELNFPNPESVMAWANSAEYQKLLPIRKKAMKLTLFSVSS